MRPLPLMIIAFILMLVLTFGTNLAIMNNSKDTNSLTDNGSEGTSSGVLNLGASASSNVKVYFFYGINCPHCAKIEPYIDSLEKKYPQVTFLRYEVTQNSANWDLYQDFNQRYSVKKQLIPSVFIGEKALIAEDAIKANLEPTIKAMLAVEDNDPAPTPPAPKIPGAPTSLISSAGDGQVKLSWKAPSSNGGATINYYVVYQNGKDVAHVTSTTTVMKGLSNGISYSFAVAAHNSVGVGTLSSTVKATPHASVQMPGAPTALRASPGNGEIRLSWNEPADDGGANIDYYAVYQNGKDVAHVNGLTTKATGLTNGVAYNFIVAAHNSAGTGAKSNTVSVTPSASKVAPGAPTNLTAVASEDSVQLTWNAPATDGGAAITSYNLSWSLDPNGTFAYMLVSETEYLHEGLDNSTVIYYRVAAINEIGEGEASEVVSVMTLAPSPLTPGSTDLSASIVNGSVSLDWTAPADEQENITGYNIYKGENQTAMEYLTSTTGTEFLDENVQSNMTYYYQVKALEKDGEGDLIGNVNVSTAVGADQGTTPSFFETTAGQVAILGLVVCGVGIIGYGLWGRKRT